MWPAGTLEDPGRGNRQRGLGRLGLRPHQGSRLRQADYWDSVRQQGAARLVPGPWGCCWMVQLALSDRASPSRLYVLDMSHDMGNFRKVWLPLASLFTLRMFVFCILRVV